MNEQLSLLGPDTLTQARAKVQRVKDSDSDPIDCPCCGQQNQVGAVSRQGDLFLSITSVRRCGLCENSLNLLFERLGCLCSHQPAHRLACFVKQHKGRLTDTALLTS